MIRVLALTRYSRSAASSRQRFLVFRDYLSSNDIELIERPFFEDDYIVHLNTGNRLNYLKLIGDYLRRIRALASHPDYDVVWIEKEALPYLPAAVENFLLRQSRVLLDLDDAWHLRYNNSTLTRLGLARKMQTIACRASVLAVANEGLQQWSRDIGADESRIQLLPTGLDVAHYPVRPEPAGDFTLGWIGGPFTAPYLASIATPLRRLSNEGVRLLVVGETNSIPALAGVRIAQHAWSEAREAELISACHVGLNPLPDDDWCRFKSGYKLIQYMAAGRAAVASPVGANCWVQADSETGLFATTDEQWYAAINRLRNDHELRSRLAIGGRRRAETVFSIEALGQTLVQMIKATAAAPRT